tara:strand:+ start:4379 stop:4867 length:489 start_codon:yes stop_codon:yes gene_type:complete
MAKNLQYLLVFYFALFSAPSLAKTVDRILIEKDYRSMTLFDGDKVVKSYRIALGPEPVGHKVQEGDGRTPEGRYKITYKNPNSKFHLSLKISYPNREDRKFARENGFSPGGDIMIHGLSPEYEYLGAVHFLYDWTDGCIAVSNSEIEEIWEWVSVGTEVLIY